MAAVRFLLLIGAPDAAVNGLKAARIRHTGENIDSFLDHVDSLILEKIKE